MVQVRIWGAKWVFLSPRDCDFHRSALLVKEREDFSHPVASKMPRRKDWPSDFSDCAPIISPSKHARRNAMQEEISSSNEVEDSLVSCRSFGVFVIAFCKFELEGEEFEGLELIYS